MKNEFKLFSIGHTKKGGVWWQLEPLDGPRQAGTVKTVDEALAIIGASFTSTASPLIATKSEQFPEDSPQAKWAKILAGEEPR